MEAIVVAVVDQSIIFHSMHNTAMVNWWHGEVRSFPHPSSQ
jgi:hypothetical protein